jgi:hypothetical protein
MADLSDVENALVSVIASGIYPNGTSAPSTIGVGTKIRRGWPVSQQLDLDLAAGLVNITVYPMRNAVRNTTRFERKWVSQPVFASLAVSVDGNVVTWSGIPAAGQVTSVLYDLGTYTYAVATNDTLETIAANVAKEIAGSSSSGPSLTLPTGGPPVIARVGTTATAQMEIRRQEQSFQITLWCPTPAMRDAAGRAIDQILAPVDFLDLADGTSAWLRYRSERVDDVPSQDNLWRRDMIFTAEFPTVQTMTASQILFGGVALNGNPPLIASATAAQPLLIGAIRFDGFYASSSVAGSVNAANAATLSPTAYQSRLPWFATVSGGVASWPAATQAIIDAEILAAADAGLNYWAFDSYQPTDEETPALTLYLSSTQRSKISFCMLGQFSNWNLAGGAPYAASAQRDVTMFGQPGYVKVLGGRPLYYALGSGTQGQMATAITWLRAQSVAQGTGNPYVVLLAGAPLSLYDNVPDARAAGADAAGAYECPLLNGYPQRYVDLAAATEADWSARGSGGFPMVPTAMTDFDPRPVIQDPPYYYTVPAGWNLSNYYAAGTPTQVAQHIAAMKTWMAQNTGPNPSGVGLVYAWNELVEGGAGLMPTYLAGNPNGDVSRSVALGMALQQGNCAWK